MGEFTCGNYCALLGSCYGDQPFLERIDTLRKLRDCTARISRQGPRIGEAVELIAKTVYPELFQ